MEQRSCSHRSVLGSLAALCTYELPPACFSLLHFSVALYPLSLLAYASHRPIVASGVNHASGNVSCHAPRDGYVDEEL